MKEFNLEKFTKKLIIEGIIKSSICGLSISLIINSLVIILFKQIPVKIILWLHILATIIIFLGLTFVFYKKVFKVTTKKVVSRLEKDVKLDERVKTMIEFKDIDNEMIKLQRESTIKYLDNVDEKQVKYKFSFNNFIIALIAGVFVIGCIFVPTKQINPNAGITDTPSTEENNKVVVSYYNGEELIIDVEIEKGSKASSFTPTLSNSDFINWYSDASLTQEFDFNTIVEESISLYAKFRKFYVIGEGSSKILSNQTLDSSTLLKYDSENECYTITLNLNEGDQFMFASSLEYDFPRGFTYLSNTDDNEGQERFSMGEIVSFDAYINVEVKGKYNFYLFTNPETDEYDLENDGYNVENKDKFNYNSSDYIYFEVYSDQQDEQIQESIDKIQQEVNKDENLSDENKEEIDKELEDLEDNLQNSENSDEQQEQIDQSKEDISESIDEQITKDEIGEALKNQEGLEDLGENVSQGNTENTNQSLDDIREQLKDLSGEQLKEALEDLSSKIDQALSDSNVDSEDPLYQAFENMSNNLKEDADNANDPDIQDQIDETFEQAKQEIKDALNEQNQLEELKQSIQDQLDDLKEQLGNQNQNGENQDGEKQEGEGQDGENGEPSEEQGQNPGGNGAGDGDGKLEYASDDLIYDPNTNSYVTYGELLNYYYEKAIQGIEEGQIPEDLESLINDYFSSLWNDENN